MAKMLPYPIEKFTTPTEERIYKLLEQKLNIDYTVLYSRSWIHTENGGREDIECDFIILKPGEGIMILEVKGGRWERKQGRWFANGSQVLDIDDPFKQAIKNRYALQNFLKKPSRWADKFFPFMYAVALPETNFPDKFDSTGLAPVLTYDELDYANEWVIRLMQENKLFSARNDFTKEAADYTIHTLLKDYTISLKEVLDIHEKELIVLTQQQLEVDQSIQNFKRLTIQGCAGSGKTLLALRQAKRILGKPGVNKILFTCFNMELGSWLEKQNDSIRSKCTTKPFLTYCEDMLIKHGQLNGDEIRDPAFFSELPAKMLDIIDSENIKFDAIIVDEGQSFHSDWWVIIEQMLVDAKTSYQYIFYDELQRIYEEKNYEIPKENEFFPLTVNIRNTARIHRKAIKFLPQNDFLPKCNTIEGEVPWFLVYDDEKSMKKHLRRILTALIVDGKVSSKDIVVLHGKKKTSRLVDGEKLGSFTLTTLEKENNPSAIRFTTIQAYRGMERKVVILTELDEEVKNIEQLNYLGASRAKTMLVYLVSKKVAPDLLNALQEGCEIRN